ncbi:redox-sensitive transcriptional activator SoxR [Streptomyces tubbatahanensis]|uniref:Redox-sensitive transcriptional activator SoxR n=1 Tax=Streptomyces tubbatahanensis TaxID=2923272 RepID=A0ABY3XTA4_9ACTN|nr:redox-sensitive transcriptional activator SoxR [Streptomyces tubbatahanensis]UNS97726.1 redox-sensitive transcriptional activator SoxR [Streptomyces tubbatahanensis]
MPSQERRPGAGRGPTPHPVPEPRPNELLTVGEAAYRSGATVAALHHYEELGLLTPQRTSGNQRRYPRHLLRRIALIRMASHVGIPLADVREAMAGLPADRAPNRAEWRQLTGLWQEAIEERLATLQEMRDQFVACIGCGCLSMARCSIVNPRDRLAPRPPT